jgi:hypothetical protein
LNYGGIVFNNDEGLNGRTNSQDKLEISSGIEMPFHMYRGQTEEFKPCLPSLGRIKANSQILLSLCRTVAFEEAIGDHPLMSPAHLKTSAYFHEKREDVFNFMGWQPLHRPEQQRACGVT